MFHHSKKDTFLYLFYSFILSALLLLPFTLNPKSGSLSGTHQQLFLPPCYFYAVTKIPCPTCGITTSFSYLTKQKIKMAFLANPFGPLLYLLILLTILYLLAAIITNRKIRLKLTLRGVLFFLLLAWCAKLFTWFLIRENHLPFLN